MAGVGLEERIAAGLARGATIVTGNQRAARGLRGLVEREHRAAGRTTWAAPAILAWDAWTASLWHRLLLEGGTALMLLNRTQEHGLWREAIESDATVATLRSVDSLAEMAADAWAVLLEHCGGRRLAGSADNRDTAAFEGWARTFRDTCRERGYLAEAGLEGELRRAAAGGRVGTGPKGGLVLWGFDRILPAQAGLLDALREAGWGIETAEEGEVAVGRAVVAADDPASELEAAARWARGILEEHPGASLAVIVPGLEGERPQIDRVFRAVLAPEAEAIGAAATGLPYEFSTGVPLAETPMVGAALDLLRWAGEALELERVSHLLLSGWVGGSGEREARAEFDAFELRRAGMLRPEVELDGLIRMLGGSPRRDRMGSLGAALGAMREVVRGQVRRGERRPYGDWAEAVRKILSAVGWGGVAAVDGVEFQTREKWESALDELATLDFEGVRVLYGEAVAMLGRIARETNFAVETREAPVQILGPEESAGSRFDGIWFLRAGDLSWPKAIAGSPLLAWPLRRELGVPGSNHAADGAAARGVAERIARSAGTVIFSYASEVADGRQKASYALAGLGLEEAERLPGMGDRGALVQVETVADDAAISALPDGVVAGGAGVLEAQAACAFRAFAEHRLFAREVEGREPGMDARERGTAVHRVLERFWEEVGDQATLKAMTVEARHALLLEKIDEALARTRDRATTAWDRTYVDGQRRRLDVLLRRWLEVELGRTLAFTVKRREAEARDVTIGPLHLTLRVDRVDETAKGAVLIDYKSADVVPSAWETGRPDAPQLPLYAVVAQDLDLHAVAFGKVRAGKKMGLAGYTTGAGTLNNAGKMEAGSLPDQVEVWRDVLTALAKDFSRGEAGVAPKKYPETCRYCAQRVLCRLDTAVLNDEDEDGAEEDDLG